MLLIRGVGGSNLGEEIGYTQISQFFLVPPGRYLKLSHSHFIHTSYLNQHSLISHYSTLHRSSLSYMEQCSKSRIKRKQHPAKIQTYIKSKKTEV